MLKKLVKKISKYCKAVYGGIVLFLVQNAIWNEHYEKAYKRLSKARVQFLKDHYDYHLLLAKLYRYINSRYDLSNESLSRALELLKVAKGLNNDEKNYLTAWCYYVLYTNYGFMNEKQKANEMKTKGESYYFNMRKISKDTLISYPMPWHVDYCDYKGLPRPKGTENYQKPEDYPLQ